jgi:hypothetical protein
MATQMNVSLKYGTHLPCLIQAFSKTTGDILELGTGIFSTPYLHYACTLAKRNLVSYENYREWFDFISKYENEYHKIFWVEKYSDLVWDKTWDIVLIDQTPDSSRSEEAVRLKDKAKYIVIHDSNPSNYKVTHYDKIYPLFKFKTDWHGDKNRATVLSNLVDLKDFWL